MSGVERCQVAIVGAGPVGTVMATLLAQAGVDVVVLEAGDDCAQDLRASTFHPPTLEMLDQIGITPMLLQKGLKAPVYHWRDRATGEVIDFDLGEVADVTRYPFRIQCEQYHLSRGLAAALDNYANAQVRFSHRVLTFSQDDRGVDLAVETMTGIEHLRADYLIAADGANSIVRKWLGIEFDGFTYPERFLCLSTEVELADYLPNLAYVNYVSDAKEWLVLLRVPSVWRVLVPTDASLGDEELRSERMKTGIFERLIGPDVTVRTEHRTLYRVHQRVAKSFREGRVLLAGDSAHLNNPLGGFGMNSGVHDAFNLFDKLLPVLKGRAGEANLALYDRQRREVTHSFTQMQTKENMAFIRGGQDSAHEARRSKMLETKQDDRLRRAYLLRQAMFESLAQAAAIA
ncbi:FAD-dependent oxidoreductase [Novosphingobium piscinae]|uniref:FAD-dependent monooxygenase n=1 Tax=Novosphingobium piscinae TaxID=1507448 RepID=A0A7X1FZH8_9SPHN|nr:FAD-dependent monooxygenase [Novosphingobium piscinae]MBC2669858.1 FAD-dependent monooxygenase [Novosphingobium piscinae]